MWRAQRDWRGCSKYSALSLSDLAEERELHMGGYMQRLITLHMCGDLSPRSLSSCGTNICSGARARTHALECPVVRRERKQWCVSVLT